MTTPESASASSEGDSGPQDSETPPKLELVVSNKTLWQVIFAILATLAVLWALGQAQTLVGLIIVSFFFSLALQPAVSWFAKNRGWRRGAATGLIYLAGLIFLVLLVVILIPAIAELATRIGEGGGEWLTNLDTWLEDTFNVDLIEADTTDDFAAEADQLIEEWGDDILGGLLGFASSGVALLFNVATIAMFTFYFTADAPRFQRLVLSFFAPERQQRIGWTWDQAIIQTGGYFYSRALLAFINGTGFFFTMVAVGMPVAFALPLSVFGGFVSVFIPAIGTYIGGAVPILLTLAIQGFVAALIVLGYVLVYQQIENYWLSPRLSSKTMELNGALAFGAALAGGALAGPMGAFMALPVAALITAFVGQYRRRNPVVYHSPYADADSQLEAGDGADGADGGSPTAPAE
jgi:predicted PurR-regulated permease PerM